MTEFTAWFGAKPMLKIEDIVFSNTLCSSAVRELEVKSKLEKISVTVKLGKISNVPEILYEMKELE